MKGGKKENNQRNKQKTKTEIKQLEKKKKTNIKKPKQKVKLKQGANWRIKQSKHNKEKWFKKAQNNRKAK